MPQDFNLDLRRAAARNDYIRIKSLIQKGAGIDSTGLTSGKSALHFACEKGSFESVVVLLNKGANFDLLDGEGRKPIDLVTANQDIKILIENFSLAKQAHTFSRQILGERKSKDMKDGMQRLEIFREAYTAKMLADKRFLGLQSEIIGTYKKIFGEEAGGYIAQLVMSSLFKIKYSSDEIMLYHKDKQLDFGAMCDEFSNLAARKLISLTAEDRKKHVILMSANLISDLTKNHQFTAINNFPNTGLEAVEPRIRKTMVIIDATHPLSDGCGVFCAYEPHPESFYSAILAELYPVFKHRPCRNYDFHANLVSTQHQTCLLEGREIKISCDALLKLKTMLFAGEIDLGLTIPEVIPASGGAGAAQSKSPAASGEGEEQTKAPAASIAVEAQAKPPAARMPIVVDLSTHSRLMTSSYESVTTNTAESMKSKELKEMEEKVTFLTTSLM